MYWYDGELIKSDIIELSVNNPAFLYGATIFTTMRVYQQSLNHPLTNWNAHKNRLNSTIKSLHWEAPNWKFIAEGCEILLNDFPVLRITILPDGKELIIGRNLPENLNKFQQEGVKAWVAYNSYQRSLSEHKTGNYLGAWLALEKARKLGANEAILLDIHNNWLETSTGNLWGFYKKTWFTPSLKQEILPGIMRKMIMENATFPIEENVWNWQFVKKLEAIAYTNCVVELIPFNTIITPRHNLQVNPNHPALQQLIVNKGNRQ